MLIEETEYESVILDDSLQYFVAVIMIDFPCKKFLYSFCISVFVSFESSNLSYLSHNDQGKY